MAAQRGPCIFSFYGMCCATWDSNFYFQKHRLFDWYPHKRFYDLFSCACCAKWTKHGGGMLDIISLPLSLSASQQASKPASQQGLAGSWLGSLASGQGCLGQGAGATAQDNHKTITRQSQDNSQDNPQDNPKTPHESMI